MPARPLPAPRGPPIPIGTLGAITVSLLIYLSSFLLWAAVAERSFLKNGPTHHAAEVDLGERPPPP